MKNKCKDQHYNKRQKCASNTFRNHKEKTYNRALTAYSVIFKYKFPVLDSPFSG